MVTKVEAAQIAASNGIPALLTSASNARRLFAGEAVGTFFGARGRRRGARSAWIAHLAHPKGRLIIDDGAIVAVVEGRSSLLSAGIVSLSGDFEASDPVEITDRAGTVRARGLVGYSSTELPQMLGRSTAELSAELGPEYERAVIHADDIVRIETRL